MVTPVYSPDHQVKFFADDADRIRTVADFARAGIDAGETFVVVATPPHREGIRTHLEAPGVNCAALAAGYQYIELDARTLLSQFMVGASCDRPSFHLVLDTLMRQAASRGQPVRAHGEMVNLLVEDGLPEAAIELEMLWNELRRQHRFTLLCGYSAAAIASTTCPRLSERIRALHTHVLPAA